MKRSFGLFLLGTCLQVHWELPPDRPFDGLARMLWMTANKVVWHNMDKNSAGHLKFEKMLPLTSREIGYCPAAHLDLFSFGNLGSGLVGEYLNAFAYLVLPDVISSRMTGFWYSGTPLNDGKRSGNGYCPVSLGTEDGWTLERRYVSAELAMVANSGKMSERASTYVTNTLVDWYKLQSSRKGGLPPLRRRGADGKPVQRWLLLQDQNAPRFSDGHSFTGADALGTSDSCPPSYCLVHTQLNYVSRQDGQGCRWFESADQHFKKEEDALNAYVCPILQDDKAQATVDDKEALIELLRQRGYIYEAPPPSVVKAPSSVCSQPSYPSKSDVQRVLDFINPDLVFYLNTNSSDVMNQDDSWVSRMNDLMDLLPPRTHKLVDFSENGLIKAVEYLPAELCWTAPENSTAPTLAPTQPVQCNIGSATLKPHANDIDTATIPDWESACRSHSWKIRYRNIIGGSTAGAIVTGMILALLSGFGCISGNSFRSNSTAWTTFTDPEDEPVVLFAH